MSNSADHTLERLLNLDPESFVLACYQTILRRDGDPGGVAYYTAQVTSRGDKLAVAALLAASDEAKALWPQQKGMAAEVLSAYAARQILAARTPKMRGTLRTRSRDISLSCPPRLVTRPAGTRMPPRAIRSVGTSAT